MARQRMIKPAFFEDEKIGKLSHSARMLYIGMWVFADDWGVIKGSLSLLQSWIFPFDDISLENMEEIINELEEIERIKKFITNNETYFFIPKFSHHQTINRPSESIKNPDPPINIEALIEHSMSTHNKLISQAEVKAEVKAECTAKKQKADVLSTINNNGKIYAEDIETILLPLPLEKTESALNKILSDNENSTHPKANGQRIKTVKKIMADHPEIFIRQKMRHFLWLQRYKPRKNPTGYLIDSIKDRYPPPPGYDEWLDQEKTNFRKREECARDPTYDQAIAVHEIIQKSLN